MPHRCRIGLGIVVVIGPFVVPKFIQPSSNLYVHGFVCAWAFVHTFYMPMHVGSKRRSIRATFAFIRYRVMIGFLFPLFFSKFLLYGGAEV